MRILPYLALAVLFTWPAAIAPVAAVPGSAHGDLWEGLWSLWFFADKVRHGALPFDVAGYLNAPGGGVLWVADPLNAVIGLPLVLTAGPAAAWTILVFAHLVFAGLAAHRLGELAGGNGWVAGILYAFAPIGLAHLHNGATEAVGTGWLAWAAVELWQGRHVRAGIALGLTTLGSWYYGVCGFVVVGALLVARREPRVLIAAAIGLIVAAPVAALALHVSTEAGNVVGIKNTRELMTVRRSIGAADPLAFFTPGDYRSPDFREIARYGEDYLHAPYLGWVALLAAVRRREGAALWWGLLFVGLLMAVGPVLCQHGGAVILPGRRAIPLPYFLIERLPGLSSLSLVWRFAQLAALALAVLAARGAGRLWPAAITLALIEARFVSPLHGLPDHADARPDPVLTALRDAPDGAVLLWPVVGGRPYLYEQTTHHKPIVGTLNFPNNTNGKRVWAALPQVEQARKAGIRHLLVHEDPLARPDPTDVAVRAVEAQMTPVASSPAMRLYTLW